MMSQHRYAQYIALQIALRSPHVFQYIQSAIQHQEAPHSSSLWVYAQSYQILPAPPPPSEFVCVGSWSFGLGSPHSDDEWEDITDGDSSEMAFDHSDLPSMIADDWASEFVNDGAPIPMEVNPFPTDSDWQKVFGQALQEVQRIEHIPYGYGIQEEEWDEIEVIPSGCQEHKEIIIELLDFIWKPWAIKWCQAVEIFIHILKSID